MQLKLGILGYGNLGKSLEKEIINDKDLQLEAIFSRRHLDNDRYVPARDLALYKDKIDVLLLALGSYNDLTENIDVFAPFDTVDSFDTHAKIQNYKRLLTGKNSNTHICSVGWDPGTLSVVRGIFSLGKSKVYTFWGKGISQGHSNAIRSIKGVLDAVEITVPKQSVMDDILQGVDVQENERHQRLCYVACVESDKNRIAEEIVNMPHYFKGQDVVIKFCSASEVRQLKQNTEHSGTVISVGEGFASKTDLHVSSNTDYTAKVMLAYAKALPQLKRDGYLGALDPLDIPLKYLVDKNLV